MATPSEMRQRFEQLRSGMITIAGECMMSHKDELVGLLVQQQYSEHVDSKGQALRPYSRRYSIEKEHMTGRGDQTDFELTGEFHSTMNLRVDGEYYEFESPSQTGTGELKSAWLNRWNSKGGGADIMILTDENKTVAWGIIKEDFIERCNSELAID